MAENEKTPYRAPLEIFAMVVEEAWPPPAPKSCRRSALVLSPRIHTYNDREVEPGIEEHASGGEQNLYRWTV